MQKPLVLTVISTLLISITATTYSNCPSGNNCTQECIPFRQCPEANKLIKYYKFNPEVIQLLQNAACGNSTRKDMVTCNKIKSEYKNIIIDRLLSFEECGIGNPINKIFNGKCTELDEFPWIALLRYKKSTGHVKYRCHGSLISKKYVVTAAHCLDLSDADKKKKGVLHSVVLGEYDTSTLKDCVNENDCADPIQEFSIERYHIYPRSEIIHNDIGLIRLNGSVIFSDFVKPICLPFNLTHLENHEILWIAGWGKTENNTVSRIKLKARIFALSGNECYERIRYNPDNSELCAGSDNRTDTCKGDSGGPLMVDRIFGNERKTFLVGAVSFGLQCGSEAAIYANVIKFTDWIVTKIED